MSLPKDRRFTRRNATSTWQNAVNTAFHGKDVSLCERAKKLIEQGILNTFVRVHLERCEVCKAKYAH